MLMNELETKHCMAASLKHTHLRTQIASRIFFRSLFYVLFQYLQSRVFYPLLFWSRISFCLKSSFEVR